MFCVVEGSSPIGTKEEGLLEKTVQRDGWYRLHMPLCRELRSVEGTVLYTVEENWVVCS